MLGGPAAPVLAAGQGRGERVVAVDPGQVLRGPGQVGVAALGGRAVGQVQRPVLVMLPNKTLAAQFANELREMLPNKIGRASCRERV